MSAREKEICKEFHLQNSLEWVANMYCSMAFKFKKCQISLFFKIKAIDFEKSNILLPLLLPSLIHGMLSMRVGNLGIQQCLTITVMLSSFSLMLNDVSARFGPLYQPFAVGMRWDVLLSLWFGRRWLAGAGVSSIVPFPQVSVHGQQHHPHLSTLLKPHPLAPHFPCFLFHRINNLFGILVGLDLRTS